MFQVVILVNDDKKAREQLCRELAGLLPQVRDLGCR